MLKTGEKFGASLKKARLAINMSQAQLAKAIGSSDGSVSNWETGVSSPQAKTVEKLNAYLFGSAETMPNTAPKKGPSTTIKKTAGKMNGSLKEVTVEEMTAELKRRGYQITLTV